MKITFDNLLNNSVEYFRSSLTEYKKQNYKSAISDLWSGTLLLLKCKLFNIHPVLIVSDILDCLKLELTCFISVNDIESINNCKQFSQADIENIKQNFGMNYKSVEEIFTACKIDSENKKKALKTFIMEKRLSFDLDTPDIERDFKTVTLDEIKKRFKQLKEPNEVYKKYEEKLERIKTARNRLEHYVNDFNSEQLLAMFEHSIPFINDFLEYELEINAETVFSNWSEFLEIKQLADARLETVEKFIHDNWSSYKDCPEGLHESECTMCGNRSVDIGNGVLYCKYCGNEDKYHICSECYEVFPENGFYSFHEEIGMCDDCLMYKANKD
jgi:DNA repair exonuclease SbcCD ATPase subunit